jgi:hypothetical protein
MKIIAVLMMMTSRRAKGNLSQMEEEARKRGAAVRARQERWALL